MYLGLCSLFQHLESVWFGCSVLPSSHPASDCGISLFPFWAGWCGWSRPLLSMLAKSCPLKDRIVSFLGAGVGRSQKSLSRSLSKSGVIDVFWVLQTVVCSLPVDMLCGFIPIRLFLAISRSLYDLHHQEGSDVFYEDLETRRRGQVMSIFGTCSIKLSFSSCSGAVSSVSRDLKTPGSDVWGRHLNVWDVPHLACAVESKGGTTDF